MFAVDLGKTLFFNVGIDLFSICIISIVYRSLKSEFTDTQDVRLLCSTALFVMLTLLSDIATWLLNGRPGQTMRFLGYTVNIIYLIMQLVVIFKWLHYAYYRTYKTNMSHRREVLVNRFPFLIMSVIILTCPLNGWCFYYDENNYYHRGVLSLFLSAVLIVYLIVSSAMALKQCRKEVLNDRREELRLISIFTLYPLAGGAAQALLYGCSLLWPCVTAAILQIYVNIENQAVSQDPLTHMNNRGNLDRFLHILEDSQAEQQVSLIMADIDSFKKINDIYGHAEGDNALIQTADIIRRIFSGTPAFLARYGGDEFVIVMPGCSIVRPKRAFPKFRNNLKNLIVGICLPISCP